MKIILSRKGFDSKFGGYPSPILSDGTLLSLPVYADNENEKVAYEQLHYGGKSYAQIIAELTKGKFTEKKCHLDPDIRKDILLSRPDGWKPAFGQSNAAMKHLINKKVKEGDLFLFFGYFQDAEEIDGNYQYVRGSKQKHIIWGYLQIGKILSMPTKKEYPWLEPHPHLDRQDKLNNTIFVARDKLSWDENKFGAGTLNVKNNHDLVLTKEKMSRSCWQLPDFMKDVEISYHTKDSWKNDYFKSAEIGQEFVISSEKEDLMLELQNWASGLISKGQ